MTKKPLSFPGLLKVFQKLPLNKYRLLLLVLKNMT